MQGDCRHDFVCQNPVPETCNSCLASSPFEQYLQNILPEKKSKKGSGQLLQNLIRQDLHLDAGKCHRFLRLFEILFKTFAQKKTVSFLETVFLSSNLRAIVKSIYGLFLFETRHEETIKSSRAWEQCFLTDQGKFLTPI